MKNVVNPAVKFSYSIIKGSPQSRREMVSKFNEQIFEGVYSRLENDSVHISDIKRVINEVIPEKKKIEIKPFKAKGQYEGGSDYTYDSKGHITGQTIEMPMKKCRMKQNAMVTFMHELTHVLDTLVNPKFTARTNTMYKKELYTKSFDKVMNKRLYKYEKFSNDTQKNQIIEERRQDVKKFLDGKTAEEKIDYIQEMRNTLQTEKNAYSEQYKYAQILKERGKSVEETDLENEVSGYMFDEKLQMLKETGFEIIAKERKSFAKKLKKKQIN